MKYFGIGYKGSKSRIAVKLIDAMPSAEYFVDLFAGGCAVTHAAILSGKYHKFIINDIDGRGIRVFMAAYNGTLPDKLKWVSREEFMANAAKKISEQDALIALCYSFYNDMCTYFVLKDKERLYKALHNAIVFDEWDETASAFKTLRNELSKTDSEDIYKRRKIARVVIGNSLWGAEEFTRFERMKSLNYDIRNAKCEVSFKSYEKVKIPRDAVVYCDIPYENTSLGGYAKLNKDKFLDWAEEMGKSTRVFISEYKMPEDRFKNVLSLKVISGLDHIHYSSDKDYTTHEGLYIPLTCKWTREDAMPLFNSN